MLKQCTACAVDGIGPKPISEFRPSNRYRSGYETWCRQHKAQLAAKWRQENPAKSKLSEVRGSLKARYGISADEYQRMYHAQNGCCAICKRAVISQIAAAATASRKGKIDSAHVDHCHKTGRVRGLLCSECNTGIGYLKENAEVLQNAIAYLHSQKIKAPGAEGNA